MNTQELYKQLSEITGGQAPQAMRAFGDWLRGAALELRRQNRHDHADLAELWSHHLSDYRPSHPNDNHRSK